MCRNNADERHMRDEEWSRDKQKKEDELALATYLSDMSTGEVVRRAKASTDIPAEAVFSLRDKARLIHAMLLDFLRGVE